MHINLLKDQAAWKADPALVFVFQDSDDLPGRDGLEKHLVPWLFESPGLEDFRAKPGAVRVLYGPADATIRRVVLVGLGKKEEYTLETLRKGCAAAFMECRGLGKGVEPGIALDCLADLPGDTEQTVEEAFLAAMLGLYRFLPFKTANKDEEPSDIETANLLCPAEPEPGVAQAVNRARATAAGVMLARDLVNTPSNTATPTYLAGIAAQMADDYGFSLQVLDRDEAVALGMGGFTAVAQGSEEPPRFIVLKSLAEVATKKPLVIVGKGVTFDTGGISIKPSANMHEMKGDMGGAAAVLGFFKAYGELGLDCPVVGIMPCTDNMPDSRSYKPGDVVRTLSGKTVEIMNTDAEGRMLLCDGLAYSERFKPGLLVDIATLTGACVVALGPKVGAVFSPKDELAGKIYEIGQEVGDKFWQMPLWDMYFEDLKSDVADLKNVGSRMGGAIHAAMFLKQFVPEGVDWAHLDIAGPSWSGKGTGKQTAGGTGFGVRTLLRLALENGDQTGQDS